MTFRRIQTGASDLKRQSLRASVSRRKRRRRSSGLIVELLETRCVLSALGIIDPPGDNIDASTFVSGSFQVTNTSTTGQLIDRVELDVSSAIFADIVFDPFGLAGDPVGKELTVDSEGGTGFSSFQYLGPRDGGFDAIEIFFSDFQPGETFTFSIDNDPTSIQGLPQPGPNNSGSNSGLEMVGAQLTVDFSDATSLSESFFRVPGSLDGSQVFVEPNLPPQPTIEVLGVATTPTTVSSANQTVRVSGPIGSEAVLLVVEGALYDAGGGFDLDPFEANTALGVNEVSAVVGPGGFVDIPISLTTSNDDGGINHIIAAFRDGSGRTGPLSSLERLQLGGLEKIQFAQAATYPTPESSDATLSLVRRGDTSAASQVEVNLAGGTATAGIDFDNSLFPLVVDFAADETTQTVVIPITQDSQQEPVETIELSLTPLSGGTLGENSSATVEIVDDDTQASVVRINAGGPQYTDTDGSTWEADAFFSGGNTHITADSITGTPDDVLYQSERYGNVSYSIPVVNSTYDVNLKFAEVFWTEPGKRIFAVTIEGQPVIDDLDIFAEAGHDEAYDEHFTGFVVADGTLDIQIITIADNAKIAAIEVLPGASTVQFSQTSGYQDDEGAGISSAVTVTRSGSAAGTSEVEISVTGGTATPGLDYDASGFPISVTFEPGQTIKAVPIPLLQDDEQEGVEDIGLQLTAVAGSTIGPIDSATLSILDDEPPAVGAVRINAGGSAYTTLAGDTFDADVYFAGGAPSSTTVDVHKTDDDPLYQTERQGPSLGYDIPIGNGNYILQLHFAEHVHSNFGARRFDVFVEEELAIADLDVFSRSRNAFFPGKHSALVVTLPQVSITDESLTLFLQANLDVATISAIEAIPLAGPLVLLNQTNGNSLVSENGIADTYSLVLNSQPTDDVTITIDVGDQITVDTASVTFTPANYDVPQVVSVEAVDDVLPEGTTSVDVTHSVSSLDNDYDGIAVTPELVVRILDDDVPPVIFDKQTVADTTNPTTAAWGPDGRLYVGHVTGEIKIYTFDDDYVVTDVQVVTTIQEGTNVNILGVGFSPFDESSNPSLFVSHGQLFANGGTAFPDTELSPYSGQVSVLEGPDFDTIQPLITGLPVSNHDHGINGLAFDNQGDLYVAVGSNTNAGVTHPDIGGIPESPFTAAILKATISDPDFNGTIEYELPPDFVPPEGLTFPPEISQVFGGEATVVPGVDVEVFSSGVRNPYDIVWTTDGRLYATDNGPNEGFGGASTGPDTEEPAPGAPDELLLITEGNYYGHPNRNRGRTDARQNVYYPPTQPDIPGVHTAPVEIAAPSTNGIDEYRATTFGGQLRGNLIAQKLNGVLYHWTLTPDGENVLNIVNSTDISSGLDVLAGPGGAILGIDYSFSSISVAQPVTDVTEPTAYDIFPWRAPWDSGNLFTIGGENFGTLEDTTVMIGGIPATLTSVSSNRIRGQLPEIPTTNTLLDVTVSSAGENSLLPAAFMALDVASPEIMFSQSTPYEASEGAGETSVVTLTRVGNLELTSTVEVELVNGSATPDVDYDASVFPQTIVFDPGETSQPLLVPITQDSEQEGDEDIMFQVTIADGAMIGTQDMAILRILDDDQSAIRINAGGPEYTDGLGQVWQADAFFSSSFTHDTDSPIEATTDDTLYQTERYGKTFSYSIPVADSSYDVRLKFAEIYWEEADKRVFDVSIEGQEVLADWDIFDEVGTNVAVDRLFPNIPVADGTLDIEFTTDVDNAKLAAIEVLGGAPIVEFADQLYSEPEDAGTSSMVTLRRIGTASSASTVEVNLASGTATAGVDYDDAAFPLIVTFESGEATKTVPIPIVDDDLVETNETVELSLTPISDVAIGNLAATTLRILDNDTSGGQSRSLYRINSGGPAHIDSSGHEWQSDAFFTAGQLHESSNPVSGTPDSTLYQTERYGDFSYELPVVNGDYLVVLKLAEIYWDAADKRVFDITVEGETVVEDLDLFAAVGKNVAFDELVSDVTVNDGELTIQFTTIIDNAKVSAIEVLSVDADPTVTRINSGGPEYVDVLGNVWSADSLFSGGTAYVSANAVANTADATLYQTERYGNFSYDIPAFNGDYEVTLKFAEIYWDAPGQRVFDVSLEGGEVISAIDLYGEVGANFAHDLMFPVTVTDGELNIQFTTQVNNAKVAALEVREVLAGSMVAPEFPPPGALVDAALTSSLAVGDPAAAPDAQLRSSPLPAFDIAGHTTVRWVSDAVRRSFHLPVEALFEEDTPPNDRTLVVRRIDQGSAAIRLGVNVRSHIQRDEDGKFDGALVFESGKKVESVLLPAIEQGVLELKLLEP